MSGDRTLTRRYLLLAALTTAAAGCRPRRTTASRPAPDLDALRTALDEEQALVASYDAVAAADPAMAGRLRLLRAGHDEHIRALRTAGATAIPPSASPSTRPAATTLPALRAAVAASGGTLATAAVSARAGFSAALMASIGAAHLTESSHGLADRRPAVPR